MLSTEKQSQSPTPLNAIESEVVGIFVQIAHAFGMPRSVGEIFGLLFISEKPLALDDLMRGLAMSKGSVSQGLRYLRQAGAIQSVYVPNDRRMHYKAVADLQILATRLLHDKVIPHLDSSLSRVTGAAKMAQDLPPEERARIGGQLEIIQNWEKEIRRLLAQVVKLLGE